MNTAIYRTDDPDLETIEFGAAYRTHAPRTGEPWALYKIDDDCSATSIEPLETSDGWDDVYEYAVSEEHIWDRIARLAHDADLANATLEVAIIPIVKEGMDPESRALLYRFTWSY